MEFFDSHSHYNSESFENDRKEIIEETFKFGITTVMCAGYNLEQSKNALKLAEENDFIYASAGISPNDIEDFSEENLKEIENLAKKDKIVAIGEIGLDYYWNKDNKNIQKDLFIKQIDIANRLSKPIIIHTRDAWVDTIEILKNHPVKEKGVFHCCPLNQELIKEALKLDFYISFSGNITFKNAKSAGCIELVPNNKILIETDSPYLSPEPLRGTINNSLNVKLVAKKIAEVKNLDIEEVAKMTRENTMRIFNIKE